MCDLRIKFAPNAPGPIEGSLTVTSVEGSVASLSLAGIGGDHHLLYGQLHDWETSSFSVPRQNAIYANAPEYNSELADDFLVDDPEGWVIHRIGLEIVMVWFEPDVASLNVLIVSDSEGVPGDVVVCSASDSQVDFWEAPFAESRVEIILSSPCVLPPGHYWLLVHVHVDDFIDPFFSYYGWGLQILQGSEEEPPGKPSVHLHPPVWRNPGNVGAHDCTEWTALYPPACGLEDFWPHQVAYGAVFWLIGEGGAGGSTPPNDHIADATVIPVANAAYSGTNVNATLEDGEPEPSCTFSDWTTNFSVWWTFTADTEANRVTIDTFESGFDTILSLHRADNLDEVACNDDTGGLTSQIVDTPIVEGETYLIRVAGYNESVLNQGPIRLTASFHTVSDEGGPNDIVQGLTHPSPNPVRETASFTLSVEHGQQVTVEVFDMMGRRVQVLYEGSLTAGATETLRLNANTLSAGVYVIRALGEDFMDTRRVTVVH